MSSIKCIHNKQEYYCKECKGAGICQHNKRLRPVRILNERLKIERPSKI